MSTSEHSLLRALVYTLMRGETGGQELSNRFKSDVVRHMTRCRKEETKEEENGSGKVGG